MIIRVESSVTLNTKHGHYIKEARIWEGDLEDAICLLATDPETQERYQDIDDDPELSYEMLLDAYDSVFYALREGLWDAISKQLEDAEG